MRLAQVCNLALTQAEVAARMEVSQSAFAQVEAPEICNTDQSCQFTSFGFIALLQENNIRISMDGRGCWRDNIMVERFWRSLKYENIHLHAYENGSDARRGIKAWIDDYSQNRGHRQPC